MLKLKLIVLSDNLSLSSTSSDVNTQLQLFEDMRYSSNQVTALCCHKS